MSDGRDFGSIINERRLELGYSLGQLANRLGVTAAQVRAWERGAETPDDATVGRIAGELDVSGTDLRASIRARKPMRPTPTTPARPEDATAAVMAVFSDAGDTVSAAVDSAADGTDAGKPGGDQPGGPISEGSTEAADDTDPDGTGGSDLVDQPTEAVAVVVPSPEGEAVPAVPVPSTPGGVAVAAPPVSVTSVAPGTETPMQQPGLLAGWNRALRTLFDPERRYLFWLRTALTVVVMLVFLRVLAWAVPAFFDALGDILDTIETTTDTTFIDGVPPTTIPPTTLPTG